MPLVMNPAFGAKAIWLDELITQAKLVFAEGRG
jgi:hypothetical protein